MEANADLCIFSGLKQKGGVKLVWCADVQAKEASSKKRLSLCVQGGKSPQVFALLRAREKKNFPKQGSLSLLPITLWIARGAYSF
jgi:hypothetical protein